MLAGGGLYTVGNMFPMRALLSVFKPKGDRKLVSVVLRDDRVDVVSVRREAGSRPRVMFADSVEKLGNDESALEAVKRGMKLGECHCTTLLRRGDYQLIPTDIVDGPIEEAREAARWKLKDQVEFAVETAAIDLLPAPSHGRGGQAYAVLAPEASVGPLVRAFQAAGLVLTVVDLPEMSQRNLANLFEEEGRALATLIFDDDEGLLTFTMNGDLLIARHVEISARQLVAAGDERRSALFDRIELELQRSLDNFERMYSSLSLQRLLVAPLPGVDGLLGQLRSNLAIPVSELEIGSVLNIDLTPGLRDPMKQFQSLRALGAALREEVAA